MFVTLCPDCDARIDVSPDIESGVVFECPECGASLEVVSLDPLEVDLALGYTIDYGTEVVNAPEDEWKDDLDETLKDDEKELEKEWEDELAEVTEDEEEQDDDWEDAEWDDDWEDEDWDDDDWDEDDWDEDDDV
jgi:lysine biosynthesis protein LysW